MTRFCMFPGQGSQYVGMGKDQFEKYPHLANAASDVLGYDVVEFCQSGSNQQLSNTSYTQPLIYIVNALSYLEHVETTGIVPEWLAGHSLGEYSALFAAGCFDFVSGLEIVQERGRLMSTIHGGSMYAVMGMSPDDIAQVLSAHSHLSLSIANYNDYTQTVIAGKYDNYEDVLSIFTQHGASNVHKLNVSACFHTHHMKAAALEFKTFLSQYRLSTPRINVIANVTGHPYTESDDIGEMLVKQIYSPVLWLHTMEYLLPIVNSDWSEVGPGSVLTKLATRITESLHSTVN